MNAEDQKTGRLLPACFWNSLLFLSAGTWLLVFELVFLNGRFLELAIFTAAWVVACGLLLTLGIAFIQHNLAHQYHLSLFFFGASLVHVRRMVFYVFPPIALVRFVKRLSADWSE
jgi:hypothetical protein